MNLSILAFIDNKLKSVILRSFNEIREGEFNRINAESKSVSEIAEIKNFMVAIDTKCAALLAHIWFFGNLNGKRPW